MDLENRISEIVASDCMTVTQKAAALAKEAENLLPYPRLSASTQEAFDKGILCDLGEGHAPYRPRYILPDYARLFETGSDYLGLPPPRDLEEAVHTLLCFYHHVPSITGFPVYLGKLDELLGPFIPGEDSMEADSRAFRSVRLFLRSIDRMFPDAFVHANIGPKAAAAGRMILAAEAELCQPVPNLSLLYRPAETEREYALQAVKTALAAAKPYFVNDAQIDGVYPGGYGVASCYNILPLGGGSYTLVRINLKRLFDDFSSRYGRDTDRFLSEAVPATAAQAVELANARSRFLVEESGFFQESFLVKEGFISPARFTAMIGVVGMAEAVNGLLQGKGPSGRPLVYGSDREANELSYRITERLFQELQNLEAPLCRISGSRAVLHAQVGINSDVGVTPGTRIAVGDEPELLDHVLAEAPHHGFFTSGTSTILAFEDTVRENPEAVLDVVDGAFAHGVRVLSLYSAGSDVVRVSGYLVRKSDMRTIHRGGNTVRSTDTLAAEGVNHLRSLERRVFGVS